jgi:hypothetical protein
MFSSATSLCLFLTLTLLSGCSQAKPTESGSDIASWTVQIRTGGGFIGIGKGNVTVLSNGKVVSTRPDRSGEPGRPCEGELAADELRIVNEAVRRTKPGAWKIEGLNVAAPDAFGYVLELQTEGTGGKQVSKLEWYDNTENKLPADAKRLVQSVFSSIARAVKNCP